MEIDAAKAVARHLRVRAHRVIDLDLSFLDEDTSSIDDGRRTKGFYFPARNTIFLSLALAWAEALYAQDIFIGVNPTTDEYPDRRSDFLAQFESMARFAVRSPATVGQIHILTPLDGMTKADTIREGHRLGLDYRLTHTCFEPTTAGKACGACTACIARANGFADVGYLDPALYE